MKNIPSDYKLLKEIYRRYYPQFKGFSAKNPDRSSKIYVPIDIESIAKHFGIDPDIIFGQLRCHLERKYGYKNDDGTLNPLFSISLGKDRHVIHFPLLASVLADLRAERNKQNLAMYLSIAAITVSLMTFAVHGIRAWHDITPSPIPQKKETVSNQQLPKPETPKKPQAQQ